MGISQADSFVGVGKLSLDLNQSPGHFGGPTHLRDLREMELKERF